MVKGQICETFSENDVKLTQAAGTSRGDDDNWGVKDLNKCCGRMNVKIPSDIPAGDYLLRAEVIALHAARAGGGAQFHITCCNGAFIMNWGQD